jgi:hypothetical protein
MRCSKHRKVIFESERAANRARALIARRRAMRAYLDPECGWWHLTRQYLAPSTEREPS